MKKIFLILTIFISSFVLISCLEQERTGQKVEITQTVTITTSYDKDGVAVTKVETRTEEMFINPIRVASFSYGAADMLDFAGLENAGIELFGLSKGTNLPNLLKKFEDKMYPNIGTLFEEDLTVLDLFNPELIILDGRSASLYSKLKELYPNADILDVSNTTYSLKIHEEAVINLGKIFPKINDILLNEMNEIKLLFNGISEITKDYKALFLLSNGKAISTYNKTSRYAVLFNEFGFLDANPSGVISGSHGDDLTYELLIKINPDVLFIMDRASGVGTESGLNDLLNNSLFKQLDAVKNEKVYQLDTESWYLVTGGFTTTRQMIKDIKMFTNDTK